MPVCGTAREAQDLAIKYSYLLTPGPEEQCAQVLWPALAAHCKQYEGCDENGKRIVSSPD